MKRILPLLLIAGLLALPACGPKEDWNDPAWIIYQMGIGNPQGFTSFAALPEDVRREHVPSLVDLYNQNVRRDMVLQQLLPLGDQRAKEIFLNALQRENDMDAALGARGLAAIGDDQSSSAVAQRMGRVTQRDAYAPFLDALRAMPTPAAGEEVSSLIQRPASRIGGVSNVRSGCRILRELDELSPEMVQGLVFAIANFNPQPFEDPLQSCELTLLRHADAVTPALVEVFQGNNERVNEHVRSLNYPVITGRLRAAAVLSSIASGAAADAVTAWFASEHPLPRAELAAMEVAQQQEWYNRHGEFFQTNTVTLTRSARPQDIETLRSLATTGEGQLLNNFAEWFTLSDGAEIGLRQGAQEALAKVGTDEDRTALWTAARTGTSMRGGARVAQMMRLNLVHYLGRTASPAERSVFEAVVAAQPENFRPQFSTMEAYLLVAEACEDNIACYADFIREPRKVLEGERAEALLAGIEDEARRTAVGNAMAANARNAGIWQLSVRFRDQAAAGDALAGFVGHEDMNVRLEVALALFNFEQLGAGARARIEEQIESDQGVRGVQLLGQVLHNLRLLIARHG